LADQATEVIGRIAALARGVGEVQGFVVVTPRDLGKVLQHLRAEQCAIYVRAEARELGAPAVPLGDELGSGHVTAGFTYYAMLPRVH